MTSEKKRRAHANYVFKFSQKQIKFTGHTVRTSALSGDYLKTMTITKFSTFRKIMAITKFLLRNPVTVTTVHTHPATPIPIFNRIRNSKALVSSAKQNYCEITLNSHPILAMGMTPHSLTHTHALNGSRWHIIRIHLQAAQYSRTSYAILELNFAQAKIARKLFQIHLPASGWVDAGVATRTTWYDWIAAIDDRSFANRKRTQAI